MTYEEKPNGPTDVYPSKRGGAVDVADVRVVTKGGDLAAACRRAGVEENEIFVVETRGGGYWVCSWDGHEAHDLSPRQPYATEAEAIKAAREAIAQR